MLKFNFEEEFKKQEEMSWLQKNIDEVVSAIKNGMSTEHCYGIDDVRNYVLENGISLDISKISNIKKSSIRLFGEPGYLKWFSIVKNDGKIIKITERDIQ